MPTKSSIQRPLTGIRKCPTGIQGLDEITAGGLPAGRPTLVCGAAGCGKSLFAMEFLVRGITQFDEPGVLMTFEEPTEDVTKNVASLGFDLKSLVARKKLALDFVRIERSEIEETGEYDLEGLFIRIAHAIDSVGAKRIVLDTIESLFAGLSNQAVLRSEIRRLFNWLKEKEITAVITGERGDGALTRQGLEEYVSDCVILLDHRITEQISTRRLRVVKYRGSTHGTNEYPFLIDEHGISVLPVTSLSLDHKASSERLSTGIRRLDTMLDGKGVFRGSSVLISGTAGTGKTSIACHFANASCARGERALYFAFEESSQQIIRNMRSIGVDLQPHIDSGRMQMHNSRPTLHGLEAHLVQMHKLVRNFKPKLVVIDPITNLINAGTITETRGMLLRLVDFLKSHQITAVFSSLTHDGMSLETSDVGISSLVDTWILLRDIEMNGERNRALYLLKSRGMAHSNQVREFVLSRKGIELIDVYTGPSGVLTGSSRLAQEAAEQAQTIAQKEESDRLSRELARKRAALDAQIAILKVQFEAEAETLSVRNQEQVDRGLRVARERLAMAKSRKADVSLDSTSKNGARNGKGVYQ